jgi:hypothetical protein
MVELAILNGRRARTVIPVPRLPCNLGREGADIPLPEPGVASLHATLSDAGPLGFTLDANGDASLYADGKQLTKLPLRDGTVFDIGSVRLQFRIQPARPRNLRGLERLAFGLIALTGAAEIGWLVISRAWP